MSDFFNKEREAAKKASRNIQQNVNTQHQRQFGVKSGMLTKASVRPRYKKQTLDSIVISIPHYAFKLHYGSDKKGETKAHMRRQTRVLSFVRKVKGKSIRVSSFTRQSATIAAHNKGITYKSFNNIGIALSRSSIAMNELADSLAENRIIAISSIIDF